MNVAFLLDGSIAHTLIVSRYYYPLTNNSIASNDALITGSSVTYTFGFFRVFCGPRSNSRVKYQSSSSSGLNRLFHHATSMAWRVYAGDDAGLGDECPSTDLVRGRCADRHCSRWRGRSCWRGMVGIPYVPSAADECRLGCPSGACLCGGGSHGFP